MGPDPPPWEDDEEDAVVVGFVKFGAAATPNEPNGEPMPNGGGGPVPNPDLGVPKDGPAVPKPPEPPEPPKPNPGVCVSLNPPPFSHGLQPLPQSMLSLGRPKVSYGGPPVVSSYPNVVVVYPAFGRYVVYLISPDDPVVLPSPLDPFSESITPPKLLLGFATNLDFAGALESSIKFRDSLAAEHLSG